LDGVLAGCDRATHAVEQMLTLARLAPDAVSSQPTSVELRVASLLSSVGDAGTGHRARAVDRAADRRLASGHHPARLAGDDHRTTGHDCSTTCRG
jgi:hypothetical protein